MEGTKPTLPRQTGDRQHQRYTYHTAYKQGAYEMNIRIKKLSDFAKYFNPLTWRTWRNYTYYRIFSDYFIVIEHA